MDNTFLIAQKATIEAQIIAYQTAAASLASGAIESYTLDTGQTRQTVTKINVASLQRTINSLYNQLATICARLEGGTTLVRPNW